MDLIITETQFKDITLKKFSAIIQSTNILAQQRKALNGLMYFARCYLGKYPETKFFKIDIKILKKLIGSRSTGIDQLTKAVQLLMKAQIKYNILNKDHTIAKSHVINILQHSIVGGSTYTFKFSDEIYNNLLNPKMYALINLNMLKWLDSKYSIALYELAQDYIGVTIPKMSIYDFRLLMGVGDKYKNGNHLCSNVIEPAVKEINAKTDLYITYELIKNGRTIAALQFFIEKNNKDLLLPENSNQPINLDNIQQVPQNAILTDLSPEVSIELNELLMLLPEKLRMIGKTLDLINQYLIDRGCDWVKSNIDYFNAHSKKKNFTYLKIVFEKDSAEEYRAELKLKAKENKKAIELAKVKEEDESQSKADFVVTVDKAEQYFQTLKLEEQSQILLQISKLMIFVPAGYKKHRNLGAKLVGYFKLKKIDFMGS